MLYYSVDPMRLKLGNPFNTMKNVCPYSRCFRLTFLTFPARVDAQEAQREMCSHFYLNTCSWGQRSRNTSSIGRHHSARKLSSHRGNSGLPLSSAAVPRSERAPAREVCDRQSGTSSAQVDEKHYLVITIVTRELSFPTLVVCAPRTSYPSSNGPVAALSLVVIIQAA